MTYKSITWMLQGAHQRFFRQMLLSAKVPEVRPHAHGLYLDFAPPVRTRGRGDGGQVAKMAMRASRADLFLATLRRMPTANAEG